MKIKQRRPPSPTPIRRELGSNRVSGPPYRPPPTEQTSNQEDHPKTVTLQGPKA